MIAAYPFASTKTVKVLTSTKKKITEKRINWLFRKRSDFKLISLVEDNAKAAGEN